jgi:hypothetical protein
LVDLDSNNENLEREKQIGMAMVNSKEIEGEMRT